MGRARYGVRDEVKETAECFYRAVSNKNLKMIDEVWAHEPYSTVAGRSGAIQQGWDKVRGYWQQRFVQLGTTKVSAKLKNPLVHAVGDVAWLSGTEIRTVIHETDVREERLRMTCVLVHRTTGWQIVSYHASRGRCRLGTPIGILTVPLFYCYTFVERPFGGRYFLMRAFQRDV